MTVATGGEGKEGSSIDQRSFPCQMSHVCSHLILPLMLGVSFILPILQMEILSQHYAILSTWARWKPLWLLPIPFTHMV